MTESANAPAATPPDVVVYYCHLCHLRVPAEDIADAIQKRLGIPARIAEGFWGTFRIEVNGREVYNRWKAGGFLARIGFGQLPTLANAVARVRAALENPA
jgi:predicted Rdx family selenoprotein